MKISLQIGLILFLSYSPFLFTLSSELLADSDSDSEIRVCILCKDFCPYPEYHYKRIHKIKSRVIYLCGDCNYADLATKIKEHYKRSHSQKIGPISDRLAHIRIPILPRNPIINPMQIDFYPERLHTLLEESQTSQ